jgi:hypothetical protein
MQRRTLFALVNLAVMVGAFAVIFLVPSLSTYAFYLILGWFVVGLSTVWIARGSTPAPGPATAAATSGAAGAATASVGPARLAARAGAAPPPVSFCIYCAADLPNGTDQCAACGHARARLA